MHGDPGLPPAHCEVAIVGAGPSGLGAAIELAKLGVHDVLVLEREPVPGGIPRHCGHPAFGMREFHRLLSGPLYARRLADQAASNGVRIFPDTTVVALRAGGCLQLSTPLGARELAARHVLLATGVRETPRSARLISGQRPAGIMTTGALQSSVYLTRRRPFRQPLIVGSELVSFSALLTCRHAGIRPAAMIEPGPRTVAWSLSSLLPRALGIPLRLNTGLHRIIGQRRVEGVEIVVDDKVEHLSCDGVVFSGLFAPESSLARLSDLEVDAFSGGPVVDQFGRCSDPVIFATGNLLRPVETAGWCWNEGRRVAHHLYASLHGKLPDTDPAVRLLPIHPLIRYVVPQRLVIANEYVNQPRTRQLQLRVTGAARGYLSFTRDGRELVRTPVNALPERRILAESPAPQGLEPDDTIHIDFIPS